MQENGIEQRSKDWADYGSSLEVYKDFSNSEWGNVEWNLIVETQHIVYIITLITLII